MGIGYSLVQSMQQQNNKLSITPTDNNSIIIDLAYKIVELDKSNNPNKSKEIAKIFEQIENFNKQTEDTQTQSDKQTEDTTTNNDITIISGNLKSAIEQELADSSNL